MQDLTGKTPARLVPTSQEGGGMVYDNKDAMTAPGSTPITPMKTPYGADIPFEIMDNLAVDGKPGGGAVSVPLANNASRVADNPALTSQASAGGWVNTDDMPDTGTWKRV